MNVHSIRKCATAALMSLAVTAYVWNVSPVKTIGSGSDIQMKPNDHLDRLNAMLDHKQQTWDLSPNDIAAIQWAVDEIKRLNDQYDKAAQSYGGMCRTLALSGERVQDLECKVDVLESALRGVQGIEFDDGYTVNVAALREQLDERTLQHRMQLDNAVLLEAERDDAQAEVERLRAALADYEAVKSGDSDALFALIRTRNATVKAALAAGGGA